MRNRVLAVICGVCIIVPVMVFMASCTEKRPFPAVVIPPTLTQTITLTVAPTRTFTSTRTITRTYTASPTITPTPTATVTNTPLSLHYTFDADMENWLGSDVFGSAAQDTTGQKFAGAGAIMTDCTLAGGTAQGGLGIYVNSVNPMYDFTGKTITVHIWLPAIMIGQQYAVSIYAQTGLGWSWQNSWTTLDATGCPSCVGDAWNTFTFSPSGVGEDIIKAFGVQILQNSAPDLPGGTTIYIDEITVN